MERGVTLQWDRNPESDVAGYRAYVGTTSATYDRVFDTGQELSVRIPVTAGLTYYFAVTAYSGDGLESPFSDEIVYTVPLPATNAPFARASVASVNGQTLATVGFSTMIGRIYRVEASVDLVLWETVGIVEPSSEGWVSWLDPAAGFYEKRFYRVASEIP